MTHEIVVKELVDISNFLFTNKSYFNDDEYNYYNNKIKNTYNDLDINTYSSNVYGELYSEYLNFQYNLQKNVFIRKFIMNDLVICRHVIYMFECLFCFLISLFGNSLILSVFTILCGLVSIISILLVGLGGIIYILLFGLGFLIFTILFGLCGIICTPLLIIFIIERILKLLYNIFINIGLLMIIMLCYGCLVIGTLLAIHYMLQVVSCKTNMIKL